MDQKSKITVAGESSSRLWNSSTVGRSLKLFYKTNGDTSKTNVLYKKASYYVDITRKIANLSSIWRGRIFLAKSLIDPLYPVDPHYPTLPYSVGSGLAKVDLAILNPKRMKLQSEIFSFKNTIDTLMSLQWGKECTNDIKVLNPKPPSWRQKPTAPSILFCHMHQACLI